MATTAEILIKDKNESEFSDSFSFSVLAFSPFFTREGLDHRFPIGAERFPYERHRRHATFDKKTDPA